MRALGSKKHLRCSWCFWHKPRYKQDTAIHKPTRTLQLNSTHHQPFKNLDLQEIYKRGTLRLTLWSRNLQTNSPNRHALYEACCVHLDNIFQKQYPATYCWWSCLTQMVPPLAGCTSQIIQYVLTSSTCSWICPSNYDIRTQTFTNSLALSGSGEFLLLCQKWSSNTLMTSCEGFLATNCNSVITVIMLKVLFDTAAHKRCSKCCYIRKIHTSLNPPS